MCTGKGGRDYSPQWHPLVGNSLPWTYTLNASTRPIASSKESSPTSVGKFGPRSLGDPSWAFETPHNNPYRGLPCNKSKAGSGTNSLPLAPACSNHGQPTACQPWLGRGPGSKKLKYEKRRVYKRFCPTAYRIAGPGTILHSCIRGVAFPSRG